MHGARDMRSVAWARAAAARRDGDRRPRQVVVVEHDPTQRAVDGAVARRLERRLQPHGVLEQELELLGAHVRCRCDQAGARRLLPVLKEQHDRAVAQRRQHRLDRLAAEDEAVRGGWQRC